MRILLCSVVLALVLAASEVADAARLVIVVSGQPDAAQFRREAASVLRFLTEMEPEGEAVVIDGWSLKTLGTFTVPRGAAYANPKARLAANAKLVGTLMAVGANAQGSGGALRLPQVLRHVATTYGDAAPLDVLVFGSPFYDDPSEPEFSMREGLIPSDAHLAVSRAKSPFGTEGSGAALAGLRVHLCYGSEALMPTDKHRFFVERFWSLYISRQGGTLVTFAADPAAVFQRVRSRAQAPARDYKVEPGTKLEMMRLRREPVGTSLYERPLSTSPLSLRDVQEARNVELGITWDCPKCDLDLYARPGSGEVLYFNHTQSPDGIHVKDFLQSPKAVNGYETVIFRAPVDLRALRVAINFYEGIAPGGVGGEIRLSVDGKTYGAKFRLAATSGNKAGGIGGALQSGVPQNPQTIVIDPLTILRPRAS